MHNRSQFNKIALIIGLMTSMTPNPVVLPAPLHYHALQDLKNTTLNQHHSYFAHIILTQEDLTIHLKQWKSWNIRPMKPMLILVPPTLAGEQYVSTRTHELGIQETSLHINCKELLAGWLGLQCYALCLLDAHISG